MLIRIGFWRMFYYNYKNTREHPPPPQTKKKIVQAIIKAPIFSIQQILTITLGTPEQGECMTL